MDNDNLNFVQENVRKSIDDEWIGLLVLSIFIFVSSIVGIIVLFFFWRRYQQQQTNSSDNQTLRLSNEPTGKRQIPVQFIEQQDQPYETQQMDVFVSANDNDRDYLRFSDPENIQRMHQFYEKATKAYF